MKNFKRVLSLALAALMVIGGLVVAPVDAKADTTYTKVTSVSEVTTGNYVVIVKSGSKYFAMSTESAGKYFKNVEVTVDGNNISSASTIPVWKITKEDGVYSFHNGTGYMNYAGEKNVTVVATESSKTEWSISASSEESGAFLISPVADSTPTYLAYNASSPRFTNYKVSSNQNDNIYLYAVGEGEGGGSTPTPDPEPETPVELPKTPTEIMAATKELKDTEYLGGSKDVKFELSGVITEVVEGSWTSQYKNMHFTMKVDGTEETIYCYAVPCAEDDQFKAGEKVTINGPIKNFKGTVEFDKPELVSRDKSGVTEEPETPAELPKTPTEIMAATKELKDTEYLGGSKNVKFELSGVITEVVEGSWTSQYKNMHFTMKVDGTEETIYCYAVPCAEDDQFQVGEKVTINGPIKNFKGTVEFDKPELVSRDKSGVVEEPSEDPSESESESPSGSESEDPSGSEEEMTAAEILTEAAKLADGKYLGGSKDVKYTLTGVIVEYEFNEEYGDASITIKVDGTETNFYCYQVKGEDVKDLKVGDHIELNGAIKNYKGTIEFERPNLVAIIPTGDFSSVGTVMILFAGVACLTVAFVSKKKMA